MAIAEIGGTPVIATGSYDRTAAVWSAETGTPLGPGMPHPAAVEQVAFGEVDGRAMLFTACVDGNTRLWDPIQPSAPRKDFEGWIGSVALNGDLVAGGADDGTVHLWRRDSGFPLERLLVPRGHQPIEKRWRPDAVEVRLGRTGTGPILMTRFQGSICAWFLGDPSSPALAGRMEVGHLHVTDFAISGGHALVATAEAGGAGAVSDLLSGTVILHLQPDVHALRFLDGPEDALLAIAAADGALHLIDPTSGLPAHPPRPIALPDHAAVGTVDGRPVLAVLDTDALRLYDLTTGEATLPPVEMSNTAHGLAWIRVGRQDLVLTAHFATVRVWNPRTGRRITQLPLGTGIAGMASHNDPDDTVAVAVVGPGIVLTELRPSPS